MGSGPIVPAGARQALLWTHGFPTAGGSRRLWGTRVSGYVQRAALASEIRSSRIRPATVMMDLDIRILRTNLIF